MSVTLDARGLRCPWPAIRLARALREGADAIIVLADDPAAQGELRAVAEAAGRQLSAFLQDDIPAFRVDPPAAINPSFTHGA